MRIVVDMDEVLVKFTDKVLKRWNEVHGTNFTRDDITNWRMDNILKSAKDGRPSWQLIDEWLSEPDFYDSIEPLENAIPGFQKLCDLGHDVIVATSIPEAITNSFDGKRRFMHRNFPRWSMKNFIATSRKGLINGDILIDDGGHNITDWCREGKTGALLMDAPWNQNLGQKIYPHDDEFIHGIQITRVYDWYHILNEIEKMAKEKHDRETLRIPQR